MLNHQKISPSEAKKEATKLESAIQHFLSVVGHDIDNVTGGEGNPNEEFIRNEVYSIADRLGDILLDIRYLNRKVTAEGNLYVNKAGRYEIDDSTYLTSGSVCEILIYDDFYEVHTWLKTTIEHGENGYYATTLGRDVSIDGMRARIRR